MFEETEHLQFSEYPFAANWVLEDVWQFFQSYPPTVSRIRDRPGNTQYPIIIINLLQENIVYLFFSNQIHQPSTASLIKWQSLFESSQCNRLELKQDFHNMDRMYNNRLLQMRFHSIIRFVTKRSNDSSYTPRIHFSPSTSCNPKD